MSKNWLVYEDKDVIIKRKFQGVNLTHREIFTKEKQEWTIEEYYPNGFLFKSEILDAQRRRNGMSETYLDGNLVMRQEYKNNELNGRYETYHPNGRINIQATAVKGVLVGEVKIHRPNGTIEQTTHYDQNGLMDGPIKTFNEKMKLTSIATYQGGFLKTMEYCHDDMVTIARKDIYDDKGNVSIRKTYDKNGQLLETINVANMEKPKKIASHPIQNEQENEKTRTR